MKEQFVFGYGSLIASHSRLAISPSASNALPAIVVGIQRGWFGRVDDGSLGPTYLGAVPNPNSKCNGVIFKVSQRELDLLDEHEAGYKREKIDQKNLIMLDGSNAAPEGDIWFYSVAEKQFASSEFPIWQSYVDLCLNGCLEIEDAFPVAKEANFAETFLRTSTDWSKHWLNDRPQVLASDTKRIDQLFEKVLGQVVTPAHKVN